MAVADMVNLEFPLPENVCMFLHNMHAGLLIHFLPTDETETQAQEVHVGWSQMACIKTCDCVHHRHDAQHSNDCMKCSQLTAADLCVVSKVACI